MACFSRTIYKRNGHFSAIVIHWYGLHAENLYLRRKKPAHYTKHSIQKNQLGLIILNMLDYRVPKYPVKLSIVERNLPPAYCRKRFPGKTFPTPARFWTPSPE